jgi:hypothetical protein
MSNCQSVELYSHIFNKDRLKIWFCSKSDEELRKFIYDNLIHYDPEISTFHKTIPREMRNDWVETVRLLGNHPILVPLNSHIIIKNKLKELHDRYKRCREFEFNRIRREFSKYIDENF